MKWSNMENLDYGNKTTINQITYTYAAETSLIDKDDGRLPLANIERWSSRGNKIWSSSSMYRVWVYLNGNPKLLGEFTGSTLKKCKATALNYIQTNHLNHGSKSSCGLSLLKTPT